ncbi:MAG: hypothetical protein K6F76_07425, partial [Clostridiales bacterium]|nr:hypothetical protein [Clostridiales bacterium]
RVTKKTFLDTDNSSQTIAEYKYNNQGGISSIKDNRNNRTKTYMYDLIGRPTSVSGKGGDIDYRYNTCYNTMDAVTKYDNVVDGVHNVTTYGYTSDNLPSSTNNSERQRTYSYDYLGRLSGSTSLAGNWEYTYYEPYANTDTDATHKRWTTTLIETEKIRNITYKYEYDLNGNITSIYNKKDSESSYTPVAAYAYDSLNRLIQEAMFFVDTDDEIIINGYTYDSRGNVSKKHTTKMKTDLTILLNTDVDVYTYNANWKDLISNYNGSSISYDNAGNPTTYRDGMTMTWKNGRELTTLQKGTTSVSYKYDDESMRTKKTVNGVVHDYEYVDGKLMYEKSGSDKLYFSYDAFGNPYSINHNSTYYYYDLNWRGDVIGLRSKNGSFMCSYKYDAWGRFLGAYNTYGNEITNTNDIALINPIRYRGYYYDTETGFYYLGSRYYDPQMYRFLNADIAIGLIGNSVGLNLFAYCCDNPIVYADNSGTFRSYCVTMSDSGGYRKIIKNSSGSSSGFFGAEASCVDQRMHETELNNIFILDTLVSIKSGTKTTSIISKSGDSSRPVSVYAQARNDNLLLSSVGLKINAFNATLDFSLGGDNLGATLYTKNGNNCKSSYGIILDISQFKAGFQMGELNYIGDSVINTEYINASLTATMLMYAYVFIATGDCVYVPEH